MQLPQDFIPTVKTQGFLDFRIVPPFKHSLDNESLMLLPVDFFRFYIPKQGRPEFRYVRPQNRALPPFFFRNIMVELQGHQETLRQTQNLLDTQRERQAHAAPPLQYGVQILTATANPASQRATVQPTLR